MRPVLPAVNEGNAPGRDAARPPLQSHMSAVSLWPNIAGTVHLGAPRAWPTQLIANLCGRQALPQRVVAQRAVALARPTLNGSLHARAQGTDNNMRGAARTWAAPPP